MQAHWSHERTPWTKGLNATTSSCICAISKRNTKNTLEQIANKIGNLNGSNCPNSRLATLKSKNLTHNWTLWNRHQSHHEQDKESKTVRYFIMVIGSPPWLTHVYRPAPCTISCAKYVYSPQPSFSQRSRKMTLHGQSWHVSTASLYCSLNAHIVASHWHTAD